MTRIHGDIGKDSHLYSYLQGPFERIARLKATSDLYVEKLHASHRVYLIRDGRSRKRFILKSFHSPGLPPSVADKRMNKEFMRLKKFDRIGIDDGWFRIVRPLGRSESGQFFVEEYLSGEPMTTSVKNAFHNGDEKALYDKLTMFAGYLAILHKKTRRTSAIRTAYLRKELNVHLHQSYNAGAMDGAGIKMAKLLADHACAYPFIRHTHRCLTHGDANPSNFLFDRSRMYIIDVERSGYRDPVYDLGMMAGELFHYAMLHTGNPYQADPFIGHMYWVYSGNFSDQYSMFLQATARNPLYMANSLLRISRNQGLTEEHRKRLAYHAIECLKSLKNFNRRARIKY